MSGQGFGLTRDELSSTFASVELGRPGNGFVFLGDSITLGSDSAVNLYRGDAWPVYASLLSGGKIGYIKNAGVAGNNTTQMLARFDTDVTPYSPTAVTIAGGMNDAASSVTIGTYAANIAAIVAKCYTIGAVPILCTITPSTATPSNRDDLIATYNTWLRRYAWLNGVPLLDFYPLLVDTTTGALHADYANVDGIHPTAAGHKVLGQYVADTLGGLLLPWSPPMASSNTDPANLLANALFITDTNTDGLADSWTVYSGPAGAAYSITTNAAIKGNVQRITCTATAATTWLRQLISTGYSVGDTLSFSGKFAADTIGANVQILFAGPTLNVYPCVITLPLTGGTFYCEQVVPEGTTSVQVFIQARAGTGYAEFGQMTVRNLTTLGAL